MTLLIKKSPLTKDQYHMALRAKVKKLEAKSYSIHCGRYNKKNTRYRKIATNRKKK